MGLQKAQKSGAQKLPSLEPQRPLPQGRDKGFIFISCLFKGAGNGDSRGPKELKAGQAGRSSQCPGWGTISVGRPFGPQLSRRLESSGMDTWGQQM